MRQSGLVSLIVVAGVAGAFHAPRPAFRSSRGAHRQLVLRVEPRAPVPEPPPPPRDDEQTRRALLDAAVFAGLAFYLGGLFGQMTNSQFVVALQSLRFDTERNVPRDSGVQRPVQRLDQPPAHAAPPPAYAAQPPPAYAVQPLAYAAQPRANAAPAQAFGGVPLKTIAINSGIMYLLGVICSPTVTPLIDHARAKLDKAGDARPHILFHPVRWWRAQQGARNLVATAGSLITRDESYSVTISQKPVSASPADPDALGVLGSDDSLAPGDAAEEMSTIVSVPDRFRVLALPQAGQSSGTFQLPGSAYFTPRRRLSLSLPLLLPREVTMLLVLMTFALISAAWPHLGLVAVQFTLSRS